MSKQTHMKLHIHANVACSFDIQVKCGESIHIDEFRKQIEQEVKKMIEQTIPIACGSTVIQYNEGENVKVIEGDTTLISSDGSEQSLTTGNSELINLEDDIDIFIKPDPIYLLFGKKACRILMEDGIEELCERIEDDYISYELYEYTGDLAQALFNTAQCGDYCFLTPEQYNQLSDI